MNPHLQLRAARERLLIAIIHGADTRTQRADLVDAIHREASR